GTIRAVPIPPFLHPKHPILIVHSNKESYTCYSIVCWCRGRQRGVSLFLLLSKIAFLLPFQVKEASHGIRSKCHIPSSISARQHRRCRYCATGSYSHLVTLLPFHWYHRHRFSVHILRHL